MPTQPQLHPPHGAVNDRTLVIGMGCRRGCSAAELLELIEHCLRDHEIDSGRIAALASVDLKGDESGLLQVSAQLGIALLLFDRAQLARFDGQLTHRSLTAFAHTGCYGVAESAALAAASELGASPAKLLIPRRKSANATFALAFAPVRGG